MSPDSTNPTDELLYQGHASLRLTTREGKVIYIDPYAGTGYDLPADLILITHTHYDHNDLSKIQNRNTDCLIITPTEALANSAHQTFNLGFITVEAVEAGYNPNHDPAHCVGYIITLPSGVTLYIAGDTSTTPTMPHLASRHLDYAFFPCDGIFNMGPQEASAAADLVKAKHSIPYHTKPGADFDPAIAAKFTGTNKLIIPSGQTIILTHS